MDGHIICNHWADIFYSSFNRYREVGKILCIGSLMNLSPIHDAHYGSTRRVWALSATCLDVVLAVLMKLLSTSARKQGVKEEDLRPKVTRTHWSFYRFGTYHNNN